MYFAWLHLDANYVILFLTYYFMNGVLLEMEVKNLLVGQSGGPSAAINGSGRYTVLSMGSLECFVEIWWK